MTSPSNQSPITNLLSHFKSAPICKVALEAIQDFRKGFEGPLHAVTFSIATVPALVGTLASGILIYEGMSKAEPVEVGFGVVMGLVSALGLKMLLDVSEDIIRSGKRARQHRISPN